MWVRRFRVAVSDWVAGGARASAAAGTARQLASERLPTVVLVEGVSDQRAVEFLAVRRDRDLAGEGVCVIPMGGAMGVGRFLRVVSVDLAVPVRGLCDEAEEGHFRRGLEQAGLGVGLTRAEMESLGFYVCRTDLETELIGALGVEGVERVIEAEGDLRRFRLFQDQPAQRDRPVEHQLRRFMGTTSGRKAWYAGALVLALDLACVPRPLDLLLDSL